MTDASRCPQGGGVLSIEDLSQPACRYCGAIHAHVARAAEKVAIVHGLMGGVLVQGPAHGPSPILPGVVMPNAPPSPPLTGGPVPFGVAPPPAGAAPWPQPTIGYVAGGPPPAANPYAAGQQMFADAQRKVVLVVAGVVIGSFVLSLGIALLVYFLF